MTNNMLVAAIAGFAVLALAFNFWGDIREALKKPSRNPLVPRIACLTCWVISAGLVVLRMVLYPEVVTWPSCVILLISGWRIAYIVRAIRKLG